MSRAQQERTGKARADGVVHAVTVTFAAAGAVMGANVARVPALRDQLSATESSSASPSSVSGSARSRRCPSPRAWSGGSAPDAWCWPAP